MKKFLFIFSSLFASIVFSGPLDAKLSYSCDNGKSWTADFPSAVAGSKVEIRVDYIVSDTWDCRDVIVAWLLSDAKFASETAKPINGVHMQREKTYWRSAFSNGKYEWTLDTKGLGVGVHMFRMCIGYWRQNAEKKNIERITDDQIIYITVKGK